MCTGTSGNLVFASYSDNSLRMIDSRISDKNAHYQVKVFKEGGHEQIVKAVNCSADESILFSGGMDGLLKIWDIGQEKVINTFGNEARATLNRTTKETKSFHTDSLWNITPADGDDCNLYTSGKDGQVFMSHLAEGTSMQLFKSDKAINCLAEDAQAGYMWYGTADSSVQCFKLPTESSEIETIREPDSPDITIPGKSAILMP